MRKGQFVLFLLNLIFTGAANAQPDDPQRQTGGAAPPSIQSSNDSTRQTINTGTLRVMTYNIRHGEGADHKLDLARTAEVIRRHAPDIVALQEVDVNVTRSGNVDQPAALGGMLSMNHAFGRFMDLQGGQYGLAILSKYPIVQAREIMLPQGNEPRVALAIDIQMPSQEIVQVICVHFDWVNDDAFRFAQASEVAKHVSQLQKPVVVLGDFNDQVNSRTLDLFATKLAEAKKPVEARHTFPSTDPYLEIDFVFAGPPHRWQIGATRVVDESVASDHRPVQTVLTLQSANE